MGIYRPAADDGQGPVVRPGPQDEVNNTVPSRPMPTKNASMSFRELSKDTSASVREFVSENRLCRTFNKIRLLCGDIVNHPKAQLFIIVLIVVNAVMMGVATFDFVTENPAVDNAFEKTDLVFLVIFTIELGMQLIFRGYTLFYDGWLVFDFLIVVLSWSFASLQIIRAFRIFRALRIITRIETMRNLVTALFDIMPRLGAITALLLLIFYIFAVLFTQLFGELELSGDYFSRLDYSLLTLFVMMTMEWADVARECMAIKWWAWAPFVAFIMITGFIVFNLIIAVVCDAVAVIDNKEDLVPDFLGGMLASKDMEEDVDGPFPLDTTNHNGTTYEEELVENLAHRIASVLNSQKEMLATLESLTKDSLVPTQPAANQRFFYQEEDKMSDGS
mmetsp:Transcript_11582/g.25403  ORF Transcript_11582/g.25403 Transcript_11582/m.25403 type:complete len:390 (-) Transcript_11582:355-1524(-)|eukprot:CAMPEP_0172326726 /NCGR_PEP_ID=MMETSP1058-20130122/57410_1 /TAXON_ID=83371 /ORGANISM="Detonula confervacea, Strain CCMP 353" /LENGTH=389 /DNA_ID=CAMNT_0013043579 /DNA_START=32 /DNA_END=1201 /DNA_ORIENTATION=-